MKVKKAVIPCGGLGTRFLPVTKAVPKEILPIIDTPVLAYIVDEIVESGIDEIAIVLGSGKDSIREYFTPNRKLERALVNKPELLEAVRRINKNAEIRFYMQPEPRGSGDAVMQARRFTKDEPFIMANGDDLIVAETPVVRQLCDAYDTEPKLIVGVQTVPEESTRMYGIINPTRTDGKKVYCDGITEKPASNPPSLYAALGRYVLTPEIYEYIARTPEAKGEIGLTEAICAMMCDGKVYAYEFDGRRYDMGDKFGAITATVDFALHRPEFGDRLKEYLKSILNS